MTITAELNKITLRQIYDDLQAGIRYGKDYTNCRYPYFHTHLALGYDKIRKTKYIYWSHAGSSANKNTLKDLLWIINTIFGLTPIEFVEQYIKEEESTIEYD